MKIGIVTPELFVGPAPVDTQDFLQLRGLGVTAILSVENPEEDGVADAIEEESQAARGNEIHFTNLPVTDFDRLALARKLPEGVKLLDDLLASGKVVYLHCTAGVNRSPTLAVAYLHWSLQWPLEKALEHVFECRNCVPDGEAIRIADQRRERNAT